MKKVSIEGMVNRPGEYFISEGETLSKLISRAGGYKDNAYSYGGALFRESAKEKEKIYAQLNYADTVNYIVSNIGKPNRSVNSSALDLLSEELRAQNHTGRVVADFGITNIKSKNVDDIELEDNDRIVIPSLEKIVYLFGDFKNPSNLTYKSNLTIQDYIDSVGGVKDSAFDEIIVIDPDGLTHIYKKSRLSFSASVDIYPGSIIYAPRDIGKLSGVMYASTVSPILSSLALSLASLNSISD
jgi:protein involved in polysaccharide export with SLBB domain